MRLSRLWAGRAVTRQQVIWCYQNLLGREPESEAAIEGHLGCRDFEALVRAFVASAEYLRLRKRRPYRALPLPELRVDVDADEARLAEIVHRMRRTWQGLGETRPHFSVMTSDAFLPDRLDSSLAVFWASGEHEAGQVAALATTHGVDIGQAVCVEYGCGVGRVTGGLAARFARVHGYDISASHLEVAQQRIDELGLRNVSLHLCTDAVCSPLQPCDLLYSRIVLQHNPPPLMERLVRLLLRSLRPGGLAIFQLPTFAEGYGFDLGAWLRAPTPADMEMHCLPQHRVLQAIGQESCQLVELREDDSPGDDRYISNTFIVRRPAP